MLFRFSLILIFSLVFPALVLADDSEDFAAVYAKYNELAEEQNFNEAQAYALKAYELGQNKFEASDPEMGALSYNVGFVLNKVGNHKEATLYLFEALENFKILYGENSIQLLDPFMELGVAFVGQKKDRDAKKYFTYALDIAAKEYGEENPFLINLNIEIGNKLFINDSPYSEDFFQQALFISQQAFPGGDYRSGIAAFSLGKIYQANKRKKKAEEFYLKALEFYEKAPPPDIEFMMVAHAFLVQLYSENGDDQKAVKHCVAVGQLRGDEDIDSARPLYKMRPYYPQDALQDGKEGSVLVEYIVGSDGKVYDPVVIESDSKSFSKVALETIQQWRYAPRVVSGEPVPTEGLQYRIYFNFYDD